METGSYERVKNISKFQRYNPSKQITVLLSFINYIVLLPGSQKGRDIKASQGKGQGAVFAKKRAICVVQGKT
jgi:hypothetical protein